MFIFLAIFLFLATSLPVSAQVNATEQNTPVSFGLQQVGQNIGLGGLDIRLIIAQIIRAILGFLGVIAVVLVIYAGYTIMTSEGNEEKIVQGKRILTNAVIGLAIILSAFAIAQFIINSLSRATGIGGGEGGVGLENPPSFFGSGALGRVVKDHYPTRDQTNVARNTSIIVTFGLPVDPSSIIENTNKDCWTTNFSGPTTTCYFKTDTTTLWDGKDVKEIYEPYYGDCIVPAGSTDKVCDHLIYDLVTVANLPVMIYKSTTTSEANLTKTDFIPRLARTTYQDGDKRHAYTFVFSPLPGEYLGSDTENVWYTVKLNKNILQLQPKDNNPVGIFENQHPPFYFWNFQTGTYLDFIPPYVSRVVPESGKTISRNEIVRIDFSEPVDPVSAQGVLDATSSFTNIIFGTTTVAGEWKISNGYQSLEFIPQEQCGTNSCGNPMYCLSVNCSNTQDSNCTSSFEILVRTAELTGAITSFQADPFTGVVDTCANALDNGSNMKPDFVVNNPHKPNLYSGSNLHIINGHGQTPPNTEENYDNYWWKFIVRNQIDRTVPIIEKANPPIDTEEVAYNAPLEVYFSKEMLYDSFNTTTLEEYCGHQPNPYNCPDASIWFYKRFSVWTESINNGTATELLMPHREFGPLLMGADKKLVRPDIYYFPIIPSTIESNNQQCLYPGRGPAKPLGVSDKGFSYTCKYKEENDGTVVQDINCVGVTNNEHLDTGCAQTSEPFGGTWAVSSTAFCTSSLETSAVSYIFGE